MTVVVSRMKRKSDSVYCLLSVCACLSPPPPLDPTGPSCVATVAPRAAVVGPVTRMSSASSSASSSSSSAASDAAAPVATAAAAAAAAAPAATADEEDEKNSVDQLAAALLGSAGTTEMSPGKAAAIEQVCPGYAQLCDAYWREQEPAGPCKVWSGAAARICMSLRLIAHKRWLYDVKEHGLRSPAAERLEQRATALTQQPIPMTANTLTLYAREAVPLGGGIGALF